MNDKVRDEVRGLWEDLRDMWVIVLDHFRNAEARRLLQKTSTLMPARARICDMYE